MSLVILFVENRGENIHVHPILFHHTSEIKNRRIKMDQVFIIIIWKNVIDNIYGLILL